MAAKGSIAKEEIFKKLLETFNGSFMEDAKILRIPTVENGEQIEIKVSLTAAKDILGGGNGGSVEESGSVSQPATPVSAEMTAEEKDRVAKLVASLF